MLYSHPVVGSSWEGFIIEQILATLPVGWQAFFYRSNAGAEIDLVLLSGGSPVAVEVKYSSTPKVSRGFWLAFNDLTCKRGYVIYPGEERYPIGDNVFALPVSQLGEITEI